MSCCELVLTITLQFIRALFNQLKQLQRHYLNPVKETSPLMKSVHALYKIVYLLQIFAARLPLQRSDNTIKNMLKQIKPVLLQNPAFLTCFLAN